MAKNRFTLTSYEPVQVTSPEIEIPEETIRRQVEVTLKEHHCKDGEEPKLTDAWISAHVKGIDTLEQIMVITRFRLYQYIQPQQKMQDENAVCAALADRLIEDVPEDMMNDACSGAYQSFVGTLYEKGGTIEEYLEQCGVDEDELRTTISKQTRESVTQDAALEAFAEHEGIKVDADDLYEIIPGESIEEKMKIRRQIEAGGGMDEMESYCLKVKAMHEVLENSMMRRKETADFERYADAGAIKGETAEKLGIEPQDAPDAAY
jgi:FKBP-type peptidyl-prolyl cis-trans isomerase (trigger factor)